MSSGHERFWLRGAIVLLVLALLAGGVVILRSRAVALQWHAYRFRQARQEKNWETAGSHLQSILKNDLLLGLGRGELPDLLGLPDEQGRLPPIFDCWLLEPNKRLLCEFDDRGFCRYAALADYDFAKLTGSKEPLVILESGTTRTYRDLLLPQDGEVVRMVGRPFPPARLAHLREMSSGTRGPAGMGSLAAMPFHVFYLADGSLQVRTTSYGQPEGWGTLGDSVQFWFGLDSAQVECDPELAGERFAGDVAVRSNAPHDQLAEQLGEILTTLLARPVRLKFRQVERETLVVRGNYARKQNSDGPIAVVGEPPSPQHQITMNHTLREMVRSVASRMKVQLVDEVPDSSKIVVPYRYDFMPIARERIDAVLRYLSEETSLTFDRETRASRILFVEPGEEQSN